MMNVGKEELTQQHVFERVEFRTKGPLSRSRDRYFPPIIYFLDDHLDAAQEKELDDKTPPEPSGRNQSVER